MARWRAARGGEGELRGARMEVSVEAREGALGVVGRVGVAGARAGSWGGAGGEGRERRERTWVSLGVRWGAEVVMVVKVLGFRSVGC